MTVSFIIDELISAARFPSDAGQDGLIGLFQAFRPAGLPDGSLFNDINGGDHFAKRLRLLYGATANSRRVDGLQDAYFIVRNPPMMHAEHAEALAYDFLSGLKALAETTRTERLQALFEPLPTIRVLEGKPPKHPRVKEEQVALLDCIQNVIPALVDSAFDSTSLGGILSESLYFAACDSFLRDFLRWPLLDESTQFGKDPFKSYFQLWRHGIKFRVFRNDQVDFYLPWRSTGELLDAGPFAGQG